MSLQGATVTFQTTLSAFGNETSVRVQDAGIDAIKRAVGCVFLMLLPRTGLDEVIGCIRDSWDAEHQGYAPLPVKTVRRTVSLGT